MYGVVSDLNYCDFTRDCLNSSTSLEILLSRFLGRVSGVTLLFGLFLSDRVLLSHASNFFKKDLYDTYDSHKYLMTISFFTGTSHGISHLIRMINNKLIFDERYEYYELGSGLFLFCLYAFMMIGWVRLKTKSDIMINYKHKLFSTVHRERVNLLRPSENELKVNNKRIFCLKKLFRTTHVMSAFLISIMIALHGYQVAIICYMLLRKIMNDNSKVGYRACVITSEETLGKKYKVISFSVNEPNPSTYGHYVLGNSKIKIALTPFLLNRDELSFIYEPDSTLGLIPDGNYNYGQIILRGPFYHSVIDLRSHDKLMIVCSGTGLASALSYSQRVVNSIVIVVGTTEKNGIRYTHKIPYLAPLRNTPGIHYVHLINPNQQTLYRLLVDSSSDVIITCGVIADNLIKGLCNDTEFYGKVISSKIYSDKL